MFEPTPTDLLDILYPTKEPMDYLQRRPSGALDGVVRSLWLVRGPAGQRHERISPMPFVHLIVNLAGPYRAFVRLLRRGAQTRHCWMRSTRLWCCR